MCRMSTEAIATVGASGLFASAITFIRLHIDAIRDRKAHRKAKKRAEEDQVGFRSKLS